MPKVIITGNGNSYDFPVEDASQAVREISLRLQSIASPSSIYTALQKWATSGFKQTLRLTIKGSSFVVQYKP